MVFELVDYSNGFCGCLSDLPDGLLAKTSKPWGRKGNLFTDFVWEEAMNRTESLETPTWVKGEKKHWSPRVKIILAFVLGLLALSPAILGIYWQLLLHP